ncbi:hypothetical protein [Pseudomonas lini]|uniref:Uncharacterized protein n=1 Tax=Pseudomonas lini TaxID=163011 RepID=A0A0J6HLX8_9PSED|nr:hypothetical protein [Pseudomonas lini]KAB0507324.1 hypothetical protein F7R14_05600 [Pseudomonas lini]KMM95394.1 hypothetical protein TU81_03060 [Pseudomonas lini]SDT35690.1 hypothetical protein SAMN04490191_4084 [Pseudomonas lini]
MAPSKPLTFDAPKVTGVADPDVDPEGYIPLPLLLTGIDVVIPLWDEPASRPGERDILTVRFLQPEQPPVKIENTYEPADMKPEFIIHIGPEYLRNNGQGELWYELLDTADNPSFSIRRRLTIDHTPIKVDLEEAAFSHVNAWGYLNCDTVPPLWDGVTVSVPKLADFNVGDRCEVLWKGYSSLNGSGPELSEARKSVIRPALSDQDIREGYSLVIEPYGTHIKPMVSNASATIEYRVYRGMRLVGISKVALVKIDRIRPGEELPCGP